MFLTSATREKKMAKDSTRSLPSSRLGRRFFRRDPSTLARALLGKKLVRCFPGGRRLSGRIVEVEAYFGIPDRAAHSFGGRRTARNASMWMEGGHAYVYFTYGMHWCVNVVAEREGVPTACLIRALEPLEGRETMRKNRSGKIPIHRLRETDLCSGPAKLTQALRIDKRLDGVDLTTSGELFLTRGISVAKHRIETGPRIGVAYAGDWAQKPFRYFVNDSPHIS